MPWNELHHTQLAANGLTADLVRSAAEAGAQSGSPPWDADYADVYLKLLREHADSYLSTIAADFLSASAETRAALETARQRLPGARSASQQAYNALQNAEGRYLAQVGHPPTDKASSKTFYWIALLFLLCLEIPINTIVFRIFAESEAFTMLGSLTVSCVIVICAHFLGHFIQDHRHGYSPSSHFKTYTTIAAASVPIAVILGVAYFREVYLENVVSVQVEGAGGLHRLVWNPGIGFFFFFTINLLIFLVGVLLSMKSYDPRLDLVNTRRAANKKAQTSLKDVETQINQHESALYASWLTYWASAQQCIQHFQMLQQVYVQANLGARDDRPADWNALPRPFQAWPETEVALRSDNALHNESFMARVGATK